MKKYLMSILIICFVFILASSFVSAANINTATYEGNGLNSFLGSTVATPGSNINHNSSFTSEIEINVSDCKDKLENFTNSSDIKSLNVTLKDNNGHSKNMEFNSTTIDSCYFDGYILHITISGVEKQTIHSSSEISSLFNYDNASVEKVDIDLGNFKFSANS